MSIVSAVSTQCVCFLQCVCVFVLSSLHVFVLSSLCVCLCCLHCVCVCCVQCVCVCVCLYCLHCICAAFTVSALPSLCVFAEVSRLGGGLQDLLDQLSAGPLAANTVFNRIVSLLPSSQMLTACGAQPIVVPDEPDAVNSEGADNSRECSLCCAIVRASSQCSFCCAIVRAST